VSVGVACDVMTIEELQAEKIARLSEALSASVKLQSHYAKLLNSWDGGERMTFDDAEAWLRRLDEVRKDS
jgi:hypothetical protein